MPVEERKPLDFIGIGAVKSGTTWLGEQLRAHPDIYFPYQKEIYFFDNSGKDSNYSKGLDYYHSFFKNADLKKKWGEFTTHYMYSPESWKLIKQHFPNVKLIVCLRNPVDMAYSFYWWKKATFDSGSLAKDFETELTRSSIYVERGQYYDQLKPYFENCPRENIKVFLFEDLRSKPADVIKEAYRFLGVSDNYRPSEFRKSVNKAKKPRSELLAGIVRKLIITLEQLVGKRMVRSIKSYKILYNLYSFVNKKDFSYPPMSVDTRGKLQDRLDSDKKKLEKLLGVSLKVWW